ncbi:MAG: autotransporter-associated beta strand repeat-containing protein [Opitutaceae bacterium]|jgi:fibronectin-binding autotransporter adhesin|nr:autotransporter-associated beta strand repeat-containing protein [Opitutaceae bacterium]
MHSRPNAFPMTYGVVFFLCALAHFFAQVARAQEYYWDGDGATSDEIGGTGNWLAAGSWSAGAAGGGPWQNWVTGTNAVLGGNAGTVKLGESGSDNIVAGNVEIDTSGYVITSTSNNRNLTATSLTLADNVAATLDLNNAGGTWSFGSLGFGNGSVLIIQGRATANNVNRINLAAAGASISGGSIVLAGTGDGATGFVAMVANVSLATDIRNDSATSATMLGANRYASLHYSGTISGSAHLQISSGGAGGAGIVVLSGANSWSGDTWVNTTEAGVLRMGRANALPSGTTIFFGQSAGGGTNSGYGTLDLAGHDLAVGGLDGGGRGVVNTGDAATLTIGKESGTNTFSGVLGIPSLMTNIVGANNAISLVKTGGSTQILAGVATYAGTTRIREGTLVIGSGSLAVATGGVIIEGGVLSTLRDETETMLGGDLTLASGVLERPGQIVLAEGKSFTMTGGILDVAPGASGELDRITGSASAIFCITGGILLLDTESAGFDYAASYHLFSSFGSGSVSGLTIAGYDTGAWWASLSGEGVLLFAAIPEVSADAALLGLAALACGIVCWRRWRR